MIRKTATKTTAKVAKAAKKVSVGLARLRRWLLVTANSSF